MAEAALDYLNGEDLPGLPVAVQADCLKAWSRLEAKRTVVDARLIAAFWAADGPAADGQKSMAAWLARFTRCTKAAARGQVAASYRVREHRHIAAALADGSISSSYARWIGDVCGKFDEADRDTVEQILVDAAAGGALIEDLERVATAALRRLRPSGLERDEARAHADRGLTLAKTFGGVGRLNGDLDAEATALAETVIGALSPKMGPEDDRTARQRRHDALAEAFRRLVASDLLPERGGSKPHVKVDLDLATLRRLPGARQAEDAWVEHQIAALSRARLAGATTRELLADQLPARPANPERAENASAGGAALGTAPGRPVGHSTQQVLPGLGDGAVLAGVGPISDGLAGALACDSTTTPTVVGAVDHDALAQMTDAWLHAHGLCSRRPVRTTGDRTDGDDHGCGCGLKYGLTAATYLRLQETMLRWSIRVLSGPGGLASFLRTNTLDGPLATPSIVLDVGSDDKQSPLRWNARSAAEIAAAGSPAATIPPNCPKCTTLFRGRRVVRPSCGT
jgi:hypothetical protein